MCYDPRESLVSCTVVHACEAADEAELRAAEQRDKNVLERNATTAQCRKPRAYRCCLSYNVCSVCT